MGKSTYKIGQLIYCSGGSVNLSSSSTYGFGNIVSIIDKETKELYYEKEVITGHGSKNTKVDIEVDIIATTRDFWDISSEVVLREKIRVIYDPHNVILVDPEYFEVLYKKSLDNMNGKLEFIKKHSVTRDEKIDIVLG